MTAIPNAAAEPSALPRRRRPGSGAIGFALLLMIAVPCLVTLPWSVSRYSRDASGGTAAERPSLTQPFGTDLLGRSVVWRCLLGGAISLGLGICSAGIAVVIGVTWGGISGYAGGRTDAIMMRIVDVLYGLPTILLVVLINLAFKPGMTDIAGKFFKADTAGSVADLTTLLIAIGGVSWLTMSRVIRGQVLSLRGRPFVEAARALGIRPSRIFFVHLLPNLIGPIVVYTTLTVPTAILQESFLSFLGIGVQPPLPSWGSLANEGLSQIHAMTQPGIASRWWLIVWPCVLLGMTLMSLNFLGDALRERLDPRRIR
ncbi:MAG: ABC transporter permease [Phycisphaeraceae bacterium]|nr:ABC transporter permease [Phycisphaeraceae bacterium]